MNILHIIATLDPAAGGPPISSTRLAAAQVALGHRVRLLSYELPGAEERIKLLLTQAPGLGAVEVRLLPPASAWEKVFAPAARRELKRLIAGVDVVHLHGVWDSVLRVAAQVDRRHGVPYVIAPRGMLDPWSLRQKRWKKWLALAIRYRGMLNGAGFLHLLSPQEEHLCRPLGLQCPVEVIPNGVLLDELAPLPRAGSFHARHPELHGEPFVLFLSRLHHKKGLDYLARAFALVAARHPKVRLVVAGPDFGARRGFERLVEELRLVERVHLVGPLYGREKQAALVDACCLCLPSRQEGLSITILEALACGVPAVISRHCHFPEVEEVGAGEVVPLDERALADALGRVLEASPARRRHMGAAGRQLVEERYTWSRIAALSIGAYGKILVRPGSRTVRDGQLL